MRTGRAYLARLASNKARALKVQDRFSTLLITEYRDYAKRSAAEREERARLRREAEIKFRGLRQQCESDSAASRDALFADWNTAWTAMASERDRLIQEEKARLERTKGEREAFVRQEYNTRLRLFDEFIGYGHQLRDLYFQEIAAFYSLEVVHKSDQERVARNSILDEEGVERAKLRRSYMRLHVRALLVALDVKDDQYRAMLGKYEALQRAEIIARFSVTRHHRAMLHHLAEEKKRDKHEAKVKMHHRLQFEKWKDRELFKLEQLRRDEMFRLYSSAKGHSNSGVDLRGNNDHGTPWDTIERELAMAEARSEITPAARRGNDQGAAVLLASIAALSPGAGSPHIGARGSAMLRQDVPSYERVEMARRQTEPTVATPPPSLTPATPHLYSTSPHTAAVVTNPLSRFSAMAAPTAPSASPPHAAAALERIAAGRPLEAMNAAEALYEYPSPERQIARQRQLSEHEQWKVRQFGLRAEEGAARFADAASESLERWEALHRTSSLEERNQYRPASSVSADRAGYGPDSAAWHRLPASTNAHGAAYPSPSRSNYDEGGHPLLQTTTPMVTTVVSNGEGGATPSPWPPNAVTDPAYRSPSNTSSVRSRRW